MNHSNSSRRAFFKTALAGVASLGILPLLRTTTAFGQVADKPVDPKHPLVKALGYVTDVSEAEKLKKAKTAGYEKYAKGQNCKGCQYYTPTADKQGRCQLLMNGLVVENGWCKSYIKKGKT